MAVSKIQNAEEELVAEQKVVQRIEGYHWPEMTEKHRERWARVQDVLDRQHKSGHMHDRIDLEVLFNPNHESWPDHYAFDDDEKDNELKLIVYRV